MLKSAASEKKILNDSLVEASKVPLTLCWRNNTGMAWQGREMRVRVGSFVKVEPGMKILLEAHPITFGLPGSGDILGVTDGRGWSVEVKDAVGRQEQSQQRFQLAFERVGGRYRLCRSAAETRAFVESIRRGEV